MVFRFLQDLVVSQGGFRFREKKFLLPENLRMQQGVFQQNGRKTGIRCAAFQCLSCRSLQSFAAAVRLPTSQTQHLKPMRGNGRSLLRRERIGCHEKRSIFAASFSCRECRLSVLEIGCSLFRGQSPDAVPNFLHLLASSRNCPQPGNVFQKLWGPNTAFHISD